MKLLHEAGQQHEEFRLQLAKERDVELGGHRCPARRSPEAHSEVVGEALKHAKIDIVGGENDFFEKIVRAVGSGKSVDRLVENSGTLTDIKNTFFNGDPEHFKTQLRQWVKDFGIKTEDLKNLTVAALLGETDGRHDGWSRCNPLLQSAQAMAKESGSSDVMASTLIAKDAPPWLSESAWHRKIEPMA